LFERLRIELDAAILVISEIRRSGRGEYTAHEASFKESGGIEYAADLAMTLTRPRADERKKELISTLRVELARDSDGDPRGDIASYRPMFPWYGLEEEDPPKKLNGASEEDSVVIDDWLADRLLDSPVKISALLKEAIEMKFSKAALYRAAKKLKIVKGKDGWRLP
jgi:hypothetical protein